MLDCGEHGIEHRITKASHLWTTGQIERRDRIIEDDATTNDMSLRLIPVVLSISSGRLPSLTLATAVHLRFGSYFNFYG